MTRAADIDAVIWDFNGTLLDDVDLAVRAVNAVLTRRGLPAIDAARHRETFGHPVADYYVALGFDVDGDALSRLSDEFHGGYLAGVHACRLAAGAAELLSALEQRGVRQFVLSAAQQSMLEDWIAMLGIAAHFAGVYGLADRLAVTKVDRGTQLAADHGLDPASTLLIGDTDHDVEAAAALGCRAALVAQGHQSRARLQRTGAPVYDTLRALATGLATLRRND